MMGYHQRDARAVSTHSKPNPNRLLYEAFSANQNSQTNHCYVQNGSVESVLWVSTTGLPDDDDPRLQQRLQQLVQGHSSPVERNVLRDLADVAEQQSTPAGIKRKMVADDNHGFENGDVESHRANFKHHKASTTWEQSGARRKMDDIISRRNELRSTTKNLEMQIKALESQYHVQKSQLDHVEHMVQVMSEELADELLQENTPWNQMYFHLVDFHEQHGHLRVPWKKEYKEKDPIIARLGPWLVQQRKDYRRDPDDPERLEPFKIVALEKLNIEWEPFQQHWYNRFEDLKRYKEEHGDCRVPYCSGRSHKKCDKDEGMDGDDDDPYDDETGGKVKYDSLGVWVKRQRNQYKNFKNGNKEKAGEMTEERIQLLDSIGFEWSLRSGPESASWNDLYNELKEFKATYGSTRVDEKSNKVLSEWVKQMRCYVKRYKENGDDSNLTAEQYSLLKELELDASLRESKFESRFRELMEFKKSHGHCIVPAAYAANQKLSNWVQTQKRQYKLMKEGRKSQMTEEKYHLLEEAGFEFEVTKERKVEALKHMDRSWEEFFAELEQYKAKYGQVNVIKQRKKRALREWCDEQRVQYMRMKWGKPCSIEEDQVTKLSELGFVWATTEIPSKGWDEYFADVLIFYIENDSFQIPDEESDLKQWCETQRAEYQKFMSGVPSLLTKYKISKLLDVSFPLGDNVETDGVEAKNSWEEMFSQLLMFKIHNKHLNIPKSMKGLNTWSCQQRQQEKLMQSNRSAGSKRSAIWEERVRRLTEVGFDWEGELPEKTAIPTNCSMFEDSTGTVDDTPLPSHPHRCTIATSTNTSALHHHGASLHNPTGYSLPTWTEHVAVPPFLDLTHNNNAGRMVMAPNDLQSLTNAMAVSGKSLASQAAQIVAELKNRNCNDSS